MPIRVLNQYNSIIEELDPFIKEFKLDRVTVSSLIQSCVLFSDTEIPTSSIVIINKNDLNKSKSVKTANVKVGLKYALDVVFATKMALEAEGLWLIVVILKMILCLTNGMNRQLGKEDALVLFVLYRLKHASKRKIDTYLKDLIAEIGENEISKKKLDESLDSLESIGCIRMKDGEYYLNETVIVS